MKSIAQFVLGLGPLRIILISSVIIIMVLRPAAGTEAVYEGWAVFPSLLFPALTPILFMVLLLDAIMSRVLMTAKVGGEKSRLQRAVWTDLVIAGLSLLVWYPYFDYLLSS